MMTFSSFRMRLTALLVLLSLILVACGSAPTALSTQEALSHTAAFLLEQTPQPVFGTVGGDWVALGLARWGGTVPQGWFEQYYSAVVEYVQSCNGTLHDRKYTEYSRVILSLTAIGKDPTDVGGYNLLLPLADFEQTVFQGINGAAYALLALDSGSYEIPVCQTEKTQATREMYVDYILSKELPDGGWSLAGGVAEADVTAMALQALAKYTERKDVAEAVDRALIFLSQAQNDMGGYTSYSSQSSETVAQVIVALTELGISTDDSRFIKNGVSLSMRLLDFMTEEHGFRHVPDGDTNLIATAQAFYALVALHRAEQQQSSLYTMGA